MCRAEARCLRAAPAAPHRPPAASPLAPRALLTRPPAALIWVRQRRQRARDEARRSKHTPVAPARVGCDYDFMPKMPAVRVLPCPAGPACLRAPVLGRLLRLRSCRRRAVAVLLGLQPVCPPAAEAPGTQRAVHVTPPARPPRSPACLPRRAEAAAAAAHPQHTADQPRQVRAALMAAEGRSSKERARECLYLPPTFRPVPS